MNRLWVDANVILRFLTKDPPDMSDQAARLVEAVQEGKYRLFVPVLVLAETVWVLKSFYGHSRQEIRDVLSALITASEVDVEEAQTVLQALQLSASRNVDFVDAYLAVRAKEAGEQVCTFDESDFKRLPARWSTPGQLI